MSVEKAKEMYGSLVKTASKFLSPSFSQYFARKARADFNSIKNASSEEIKRYIAEQERLSNALGRVVGIYNTYRDETSSL